MPTLQSDRTLITSFHHEIVNSIANQLDEAEPSFIVGYEDLNWDSLIKKPSKPQNWQKRLAIYGGGNGRYPQTNLDNFSLTLKQKYLVKLHNGLNQFYRLTPYKNNEQLGKLVSFYQELAIDLALDAINPDWYQQQREKLNTRYKIDNSLKRKTRQERIEENKRQKNLKRIRLETLQIGQIVDGTVVGFRPYGVFVDIGGFYTLLHIAKISQSPVEDTQQVFNLNDWVRAIIVYLNVEKGRVGLSTKDLESEPGQIFTEPWVVYQNAEVMAEKYKKTRSDSSSQSYP